MSPTPEEHDETLRFDPRSEKFLASLRNLLEFEIELCDTSRWVYRYESLFSINIVEAADFADRHIATGDWIVTQVRRTIEREDELNIPIPDDDDEFMAMMKEIFRDD
jgi:hypothetical protein